ncbi:MAG: hypothetical protein L6R39_007253 [Caloplaca ligustica]|nr:MAG: hypothetical protein L6R39_007253 [Caloplaca ligustica]
MPDRKVSLGGFREDPVLTSEFRDRERFLEALWSNADMAHLYTCENTADDIPGHYAVVIRTVLDKTKVAFYLLIPSTAALVVGSPTWHNAQLPNMDEYTVDSFANRDEPVPIVSFTGTASPSPDPESKRSRLKESLSSSKLKEKIQDGAHSRSETGFSLQDRLLTK